jgi:hypothetical protein
VIDRFNDERLRRKEQALCAAYLSLKNRELQFHKATRETAPRLFTEHLPLIPA